MIGLPSFRWMTDGTAEVQEEKKEEDDSSLIGSIGNEEQEQAQRKGEKPASPTQVTASLEDAHKESTSTSRLRVDLLDELENAYSCGLSRRLTARKMAIDKDEEESGKRSGEQFSEKSRYEEETKGIASEGSESSENIASEATESPEEAPNSPKTPTSSWKRILSASPGGVLTREQALEMTLETLSHQLEAMTEQRDSLLSTVDTLEGKLDAQNAKIEALESFFRQVNAREEGDDMDLDTNPHAPSSQSGDENSIASSSTATRSESRSWSNTPSIHSIEVSAEPGEAARREEKDYEDDEAWELEAAPPKLSMTFQKTGQKMQSAKTRAAVKMARLTIV